MKNFCYVQVAAEVAAPLSQVNKVTMVSCSGSEVGASKLTAEVLNIVQCIPTLVKGVTGVDITKVFLYLSYSRLNLTVIGSLNVCFEKHLLSAELK